MDTGQCHEENLPKLSVNVSTIMLVSTHLSIWIVHLPKPCSPGIYSVWARWEKAEQVESLELHKGVGCGHYAAGHMAEEGNKLTLRRLEAPIHKFIKVALPTDLERLQKHHSNILKVTAETWLDVGSHPKLSCISVCFFPPLNIYSTSIASNGIASIRSILMPAELFRYN